MTKDETKAAIDVMMAWVRGERIQAKLKEGSEWVDVDLGCEQTWNWLFADWRIKPEPMEIEVWVRNDGLEKSFYEPHTLSGIPFTKKKFREIL